MVILCRVTAFARRPLRFPRIVRLRPDKLAEEADTMEE